MESLRQKTRVAVELRNRNGTVYTGWCRLDGVEIDLAEELKKLGTDRKEAVLEFEIPSFSGERKVSIWKTHKTKNW